MNKPIKPPTMKEMTKRWTHHEMEYDGASRMGYGDVSGWARGTTRASRPEVRGQVLEQSLKVSNLSNLRPINSKPLPFDGSGVVLPHITKETHAESNVDELWRVQQSFWDRIKAAKPKGEIKTIPHRMSKQDVLDSFTRLHHT